MSPRPVRKPNESLLEYTERLNKWKKEKLKSQQTKKNEDIKREYGIHPAKTDG